jgi:hypothetical protein
MESMSVSVVSRPLPPPRRPGRAIGRLVVLWLALVGFGLWAQGLPAFVAWELARDHKLGFADSRRVAHVWSSEPDDVSAWLEAHGTVVAPLPAHAGSAALVGARYCSLVDRLVAHVLYQSHDGAVSVFVVPGPLRAPNGWSATAEGLHLRLVRAASRTLVIVGESEEDVDATLRAFVTSVARCAGAADAMHG